MRVFDLFHPRHLIPARRSVGAVVALAFAAGCASLDPTEDIAQATDLVAARAGTEPPWTAPWDEPSLAWDGHAPLSSDAAVRVALQNNHAIRMEVESIVATRADFVQAHLLPNPVVNLAIGFTTDGQGGDPLSASVVQQLAWLWKRPAVIEAADADLRGRILAVSDAGLRLVADVRALHADVVYAERGVVLEQGNIDLIDQSIALLEARFAVGEASRLDVNRVELDGLVASIRLRDRQTALAAARRELLAVLGWADASTAWRSDDHVPAVDALVGDLDEVAVMALVQSQRLDVAAAAATVQGNAARLELAERGKLPDVSVGAGFQQNFANRRGIFPAVSVTPKLFDDNSARVARAASELRRSTIEADRVRQTALATARGAWVALEGQREVVSAYEEQVLVLAESNLALARDAFEAGETDLTVLLEAQQKLNDARIELTDRQHAAVGLVIELERSAGGALSPLPPLGETLAAREGGDQIAEVLP